MDKSRDLANRYFTVLFEKYLYPLYTMGFQSESHLPETSEMPLKLIFRGPFVIEIDRDYRCDTFMSCSPIDPTDVRKEMITLHQLIFTFSGKKENLLPYFHNIGCYYLDYEKNIEFIAERFFHYYDQISFYMKKENMPTLQAMLSNDYIDLLIAIGMLPHDYKEDNEATAPA